jgi:hypothetical protein
MPFEENGVLDDETPELQRVQGAGALEPDGSQLFAFSRISFNRYRSLYSCGLQSNLPLGTSGDPNGIRTRVTAVKGISFTEKT